MTKCNEELANVKAINVELSKQLQHKDDLIKSKTAQVDQLNSEYIKLLSSNKNEHVQSDHDKKRTLLVGSSMVRNIESHHETLEIQSHSGATLNDIKKQLDRDDSSYDRIIIVAGGNDCENDSYSTTDINSTMRELILKAKEKAPTISIASVMPRPKKPSMQLKTDHVNEATRKLCLETDGYEYIDNDGSFKLADHSSNEALYMSDGVHLNYHGNTRLMKNLGIEDRASVKSGRRRAPPTTNYQVKRNTTWHQRPDRDRDTSINISNNHTQDEGDQWTTVQRKGVKCYRCGESNHVMRSCRFTQKITCFRCGGQGHKSKSCPVFG
jgi:lysophospholipase L1-like esterase